MKHRLFWLAVAALVPLVALAVGLSISSLRQQRASLRNEALHQVGDIVNILERDLLNQIDTLRVLAKSPRLEGPEPDLAGFHRVASELAEEFPHWDAILLADTHGRPIVDTRVPVGQALGGIVDEETYRRVLATRQPVIGNVAGPGARAADRTPRASVRVPVLRDGEVRYVLTAIMSPERLSDLVAGRLDPEWRSFLVDGSGRIVASARRPEVIGQAPSPQTLAARAAGSVGVYEGVTPDGVSTVTAFRRTDKIGWSAHVSVPSSVYNAPLVRSLWLLGALITGALALTLMFVEILRRETLRRERVATQIWEAEARYRLLAENATDVIFRTGLDGERLYLSPSSREVYGYDPEELLGTDAAFLLHPDDAARMKADLNATVAGKSGHETTVYRIRHKAGHWVWLEARRRLVRDGSGAPVEVVGIVRDISERVQLEEQLRQSQKMEAVGQLTGGIAHDFNNLLTVIVGNAELLTENPSDPALTYSLAHQILETAERGADLNQKLLAFSRRQSLKPERLDVDRIVDGMVPLLYRTIGEHIELKTELNGAGLSALTDKTLLESAILNLAVNARDAMPHGGTLTIATGHRKAGPDDGPLPPGQDVVFVTVTDTGTGIPPDVLSRVFEPFFTTKEVGKGSGMGLPMVLGFAQQTGGHVSIGSREGEGTAVSIVLPAAMNLPAPPAPAPAKDDPESAARQEHILVVEDEPQVLQFVSNQLVSLGYAVTSVSTAQDALDLLQAGQPFDLLFSDVVLPKGMSGVDLVKRTREVRPDLKVLLTSGYPEEAFEQHGRPDEHTRLLRKPYRRKDLAETIRAVLDPDRPAGGGDRKAPSYAGM
ncbi:MAG TPA: PAS domain S-box protein [Microvirga sp.]|nr:PAS domain S-box protein [Microvirga sp.]